MNIFEFEEKYKDILEEIEEWAYLRVAVGFSLKNRQNKILKKERITQIKEKIFLLKNIFYGFKNWFRRYDFIMISDSGQRKFLEDMYYHRFFDETVKNIDNHKILCIEIPNPKHFNIKKIPNSNKIVSGSFIIILDILASSFSFLKLTDKLIKLEKLLKISHSKINLRREIQKHYIKKMVYKFIFKIYKPKSIFLSCYYCHFSAVKVASEMGIDIIDFQHGIINEVHFGYVSYIHINKDYLANILLSFGLQEKQIKSLLISEVIPIGSFYIDKIQKNSTNELKIKELSRGYKIVIGISMQEQNWEREHIFKFLKEYASQNKNILYILIPRDRKDFPYISQNVIVYDMLDCYNILLYCDIHMTLYSSCAIEAPSFGIPNILINYQNYASSYYKHILNPKHTKYMNSKEDLFHYIEEVMVLKQEEIIRLNSNVFQPNYQQNIKYFFKTYLAKIEIPNLSIQDL